MKRGRILVVDDEEDVLTTLRHVFELNGFDVLLARNGAETLDIARRESPDLIVLDVMLPGQNGYEISRILKEEIEKGSIRRDMKIVILTARKLDSSEREEFISTWAKADGYLYKPFKMEELIETVETLLGVKPAHART
ncbi:MAG: response regulator [Candidatus Eisenbacteria bacterium]|nr:response regulator [Candidatus Eisenbacteria bacterium]